MTKAVAPCAPVPREDEGSRALSIGDRKLLEDAQREAQAWRRRVSAGVTARDRGKPVSAQDHGGATVAASALPAALYARYMHEVYGCAPPEDGESHT